MLKLKIKHLYQQSRYYLVSKAILSLRKAGFHPQRRLFLPELMKEPPGKKLLFLSPHIDDDILGCGGTIHIFHRMGATIVSIYFTDGSKGGSADLSAIELVKIRHNEAYEAADIVGIESLFFLDIPDQKLQANAETIQKCQNLISDFDPHAIFLPIFIDYHSDHIAVTDILCHCELSIKKNLPIFCYECVNPLIPNRLVDITMVIETKAKAIECFKSQLATNDYIATIPYGLNRFRSYGLLKGKGYAEAFFQTDIKFLKDWFFAFRKEL